MINSTQIQGYVNTLKSSAFKANASQNNSRHQLRVLENLVKHKPEIENARLRLEDLSAGVVISDYGKTPEAKALLTDKSLDSDLLLTSLQGQASNPASALIKELLQEEFGKEHGAMLNPNLSPEELRSQFRKDPRLLGFFHELPGLLLLIKDYNAGELDKQRFTTQFWSTFAHNGPQKGFWNTLTQMLNGIKDAQGLSLHLGTPFANSAGDFSYPNPHGEAILHTTYDRLDQGLEGLPKLAVEVAGFQDLKDVQGNLLGSNNPWTQEQLGALREHASKVVEKKPELGFTLGVIDSVKSTLQRFAEFVKARLSWDDQDGVQTIKFEHPDGTIETLHKAGTDNYKHEIITAQPKSRNDFMSNNAAQFLSRVVRNFKEEDRYSQAV